MKQYFEEAKMKLKEGGRFWIAFVGDSITSCEWVHPNWRDIVIYVLQDKMTDALDGDWKISEWGVRGFNFGYDGATTRDIRNKSDDIMLIQPDMVIGLMGGNDPRLGIDVAESMENIDKTVDKMVDGGARVVWCSSIPAGKGGEEHNENYAPYASALIGMPKREGFETLDMFGLFARYPLEKFFTFEETDGVKDSEHPNQLGNAYIAKVILKEVFGAEFDADKYMADTLGGKKYPRY